MPLPRLPSETIDTIIDYLHADYRALSSCALTCRAWLPTSRFHLFFHVVFSPRRLSALLDFVRFPGPIGGIAPYVRSITMDDNGETCRGVGHNVPYLASQLPNVETLHLLHVDLLQSPGIVTTAITSFRNVRHLKLTTILFGRSTDLIDLICAFPKLESLSMDAVQWQRTDELESSSLKMLRQGLVLRVPVLGLCDAPGEVIVRWLLAQNRTPVVKELHFDAHDRDAYPLIYDLLCSTGPYLERAEVCFRFGVNSPFIEHLDECIDFAPCANLRSLRFLNILLWRDRRRIAAIPRLLAQVTSDHMEEVCLSLVVNHLHELSGLDWSLMCQALMGPQFSKLKRLAVSFPCGTVNRMEARMIIRKALAPFDTSGVLQVV